MQKMKLSVKKMIQLALCVLIYCGIQCVILYLDKNHLTSYNGVMTAIQFCVCLIMTFLDRRIGAKISCVMIALSMADMLFVMVMTHRLAPLPGFCNLLVYMILLVVLTKQFYDQERDAVTDFLTGLYNQRGLYRVLRREIENRNPVFVVYVDLTNYKIINDNYGHSYGDQVLRTVTERMSEIVGGDGVLSRVGGDEFVLVLNGYCDAQEVTERVLNRLSEKISILKDGSRIDSYLTAYAGISAYPKDGESAEELIKFADIAMYQASKAKKEKICFFNKEMEERLKRKVELEKLIKDSLEHDYFYLVYQPQYRLADKKLRGFETLLRLREPGGEIVSPAEFIPVAEKGELILQIDKYVLRRAMTEYRDVVKEADKGLIISVNVSAKNFGRVGFVEQVRRLLKETGFPPANLEVEITEYCLVQSMETTVNNICGLRELGVQVALDDFGTGYTSLSYLAKMPINLLKVDKSLIDDIEKDDKSLDFVNAVIAMGHMMGCEVISEGVENERQLDLLNDQKCDFVQGFVWGRPMDYEAAIEIARMV